MKDLDGTPPSDGHHPFDLNAAHVRWKRFRAEQPIIYPSDTGYWVASRHDDIRAILDD